MLTIHINLFITFGNFAGQQMELLRECLSWPCQHILCPPLALASLNWIQPVPAGALSCAPKNAITKASYMLAARPTTSHVAH